MTDATLLQHLDAGDADATLAHLRTLEPAQRRACRKDVVARRKAFDEASFAAMLGGRAGSERQRLDAQRRAAQVAVAACGTAADLVAAHYDDAVVVPVLAELRPPALDGLAEALLARSPYLIGSVQRLVELGLVPRPDSETYAHGLMALTRPLRKAEDLDALLAADPGLAAVLPRMFEVEGNADLCLASVDKYTSEAKAWSTHFLRLCRDGVYPRAQLLDATLDALARDWPQFRAGWFSRFHGELAPTLAELRARTGRYLALTHSRIPPTVALALDALRKLDADAPLDDAALLDALRPALAATAKGHVDAALKLLDRVLARAPALAGSAAPMLLPALAHPTADVQKMALKRLSALPLDEAMRTALRELSPGMAAVLRPVVEKLAGTSNIPAVTPGGHVVPGPRGRKQRARLLDPDRRLAEVTDTDALIDAIAHAFEHDTDIDAFERALGALVQAAPLTPDVRKALGPVLKRAPKLKKPVAVELARMLRFVADGTRATASPVLNHGGEPSGAHAELIARVDALMDVAAQGRGLAPLSVATHRGGVVDPDAFVARVTAHAQAGVHSPRDEQVRGLLRLGGQGDAATLAAARALPDSPLARALRYALGDDLAPANDPVLFAAAARIRHPGGDDLELDLRHPHLGPDGARVARHAVSVRAEKYEYAGKEQAYTWLAIVPDRGWPADADGLIAVRRHPPEPEIRQRYSHWWNYAGTDEGVVAYSATVLPSDLQAFFAEGARSVGNNLVWGEAQWQDRAYLQRLLDPAIDLGAMGTLLLALGLAGKEPGQTAIAVDALVQAHADGRLDVVALGAVLRDLLRDGAVRAARLARSLAAALRAEPTLAGVVADLVLALLAANPGEPPRDTAQLLELLQQARLSAGRGFDPAARECVQRLVLSGKARALQKALLDL